MGYSKSLNVVIMLLCLSSFALAAEVISNSQDWRDAYSVMLYANIQGHSSHFLTSTPHGPILLFEVPQSIDSILILTSADRPFYVGYENLVESRGYQNVEEIITDSANLELARRLQGINRFIVIDDSYGYNALAAAPFAARGQYYILFADSQNIDDIEEFLAGVRVDELIIFGRVDREVRNALAPYNPEIISSESGSRFENNILIVEKFSEIGEIKQVILTNGEFIEASMMTGNEAVLFIGRSNVPDEIKEYIQQKGIQIGVLIGNELVGTATDIRRQLGISVFVKFARGSRVPGGTINPVEDLDRFPMPSYQLSMSIVSISYNRATGLLEVTYRNDEEIAVFFKSTITIKNEQGETIAVEGDTDTIFLDDGETKTVVYDKLGKVDPALLTGDLNGEVYTIFGESKKSLEFVLRGNFKIETIDVKDDSQIKIVDLVYDKSSGKFLVTVENYGEVDAYVQIEIQDLWIDGEYVTIASAGVIKVEPGKKKVIEIKQQMTDEDLSHERNAKIQVRAFYGQRKNSLIKTTTEEFELKVKTGNIWQYTIIASVLILIWLLIILWKRRGRKCSRCRTLNSSDAHNCKKCGHPLKKG